MWQKIAGFLGVIAAVLFGLLKVKNGQIKKAEQRAVEAETEVEAVNQVREVEKDVYKAQAEAREENRKEEEQRRDTPKETRRSGNFGRDLDSLR